MPPGKGRRDRDDRAPRAQRDPIGDDRDTRVAVADRANRRRELDDSGPELFGHAQRDQLSAADDAVLLGAALGVGEELDRAGRANVEEDVKQREVPRLGRPDADDRQAQDVARDARADAALHP